MPLADAAERIAFGKCMNAGQTCVAPDYVLVPRGRLEGFVSAYREAVLRLYPRLADNPDYSAIINARQLKRLQDYLTTPGPRAHGSYRCSTRHSSGACRTACCWR